MLAESSHGPPFASFIAGTTALFSMDVGCYLLVCANDARRYLPART
jgi:hypothetical protein